MRIAQEEIFGPVVSVMKCRSLDEAIAIANGVEYGLSAAIYTQDINRAFVAMRDLYTGIFYVNAPTIGAEVHLPFGGTKNTGNGHREAGVAASRCSRSGSPATSTSAASCSGRRSTSSRSDGCRHASSLRSGIEKAKNRAARYLAARLSIRTRTV